MDTKLDLRKWCLEQAIEIFYKGGFDLGKATTTELVRAADKLYKYIIKGDD